jgi:hypothetical protein
VVNSDSGMTPPFPGFERVQLLLELWSERGIGSSYDVLPIWREEAETVHGRALECGHFLAEEQPAETTDELVAFLEEDRS